jgi:predicted thioesterase
MLNIPQRKGRGMSDELQVGMTGESQVTVTSDLTAKKMGSGSLLVYSTPAMIALMEAAAVNAIDPYLETGQTTVGIQIEVRHISASPIGENVRAEAEIIGVEGKRIIFAVRAWDEQEMIGEGSHTRYLIDEEKFMERVQSNSRR